MHALTLRRALARTSGVLVAMGVLVGFVAWFGAEGAAAHPPNPPDRNQGPYLGALLDWASDNPAGYRSRAGVAPAVYGYDAPMPLAEEDVTALSDAVQQARAQEAALLVTLLPAEPVETFDAAMVEAVVDDLAAAGLGEGVNGWIRPLPELNAPWRPWGQQPRAAVDLFRRVADSVHAELDGVGVIWQPVYGAGYPFGATARSVRRDAGVVSERAIDTDGDGRLTLQDDPYGPYWPGEGAVDWVGLTLSHWGESYPFVNNVRPPDGKLRRQLAGRYGYPDAGNVAHRDLYGRFVRSTGLPMILETAALYSPASKGVPELALKKDWFRQVADPELLGRHPDIEMILWQELRRPEAEARGKVVDWRATHTPDLAKAFRTRLVRDAGLTVAAPTTLNGEDDSDGAGARDASAATGFAGTVLTGATAVVASGATALAGVGLLVLTASHRRRSWTYEDALGEARRDHRIDMLRGVAICFVVIDHINVASLWQLVSQEAIGPVSGAELFVLLSGVVLGVVYGPRVTDAAHWYDAATRMWRRAMKLWVTALSVIVLVYLLALLPTVDARVLTTYTEEGAGDGAAAADGRVYDLYAGFGNLFDFPIPGWALRDVLLLRMGPSQINIIGLYVVLLLVAPLLAWLLLRRRWWLVLLGSLTAYATYQTTQVRVLPSQFEDPFPLLAWQLLFVLGLVAGWHRTSLLAAAHRPAGRALLVLVAGLTVALVLFAAASPFLSNAYDVRLDLLPESRFREVYGQFFARRSLGPGRVVATLCVTVTAYVLMTRFWTPLSRAFGWFLLPLGRATLYVFVMHVLFVVAVANMPRLTDAIWLGTLTHTLVLAALWFMVRTRFLFRVVPT
jgi:hypothetical protein